MIDAWMASLEASALAHALSASLWVYPLVNTGHLLGVSLLVGAMVPVDLRLLGAWRSVPLAPFCQVLVQSAAVGLGLAVVFGALLFVTRATEYAASELFIAKMAVVVLATANALALRLAGFNEWLRSGDTARPLPRHVRFAAGLSLVAWLTVLTLGRFVGYR